MSLLTARDTRHRQGTDRALFYRAPPLLPVPEWLHRTATRLKSQYDGVNTTAQFQSVMRSLMTLRDRPFEIFVVGEGNFGKSTLLNALLGQQLSAVHFLPETRAFLRYIASPCPSDDARLWVRLTEAGHRWLEAELPVGVPSEELFRSSEHRVSAVHGERLLREEAARARKEKDYRPAIIEFEREVQVGPWCPFPPQVRVVDTQGLNQIFPDELLELDAHDLTTSAQRFARWMATNPRGQHLDWQLRRCDAVLWLAHARKPAAAVTRAALEHFSRYGKKTVLAVTHVDQVQGGPDAFVEVMGRIEDAHAEHVATICPLNAKHAMSAALTGDGAGIEQSGLARLAAALHEVAVGEAGLVRTTGAYNSLRRTETQLRGALVRMSDDIRATEKRLKLHRRATTKDRESAESTVTATVEQSDGKCRSKFWSRLRQVGLADPAHAVNSRLNARGLASTHHNATVQSLDLQHERAERRVQLLQQEPYSLPRFDAEGRRDGTTVRAEAAAQVNPIDLPLLRLDLELPSTIFERIGIGVFKFFGIVSEAARDKAAQMEREALASRHHLIAQQFDAAWTVFHHALTENAVSEACAMFDRIRSGIDDAEARLMEVENESLKVTRLGLERRLAVLAAPPMLIASLNSVLRRVYARGRLQPHAGPTEPSSRLVRTSNAATATSS